MKKFLLVSMIVATAICSYAADLKITGDAFVRGSMVSNQDLAEKDETTYNYYDYDFNLYSAIVVNEQASVNFKFTFDQNYHAANAANGKADKDDPTLALEHAYIKYKFNTGTTLDVGLMSGNKWGTNFTDTETNCMRIKVTQVVAPELTVLAIIQKNTEVGATTDAGSDKVIDNGLDAEDNDSDTYYLAAIIKAGPLTLKPLVAYGRDGENKEDASVLREYDKVTYVGILGVDVTTDVIGLASEFRYNKVDMDGGLTGDDPDQKTYGCLIDVFANVDTFKVGFVYIYASADEEDGILGLGGDLNATIVMDETFYDKSELAGVTVYKLYAEAKFDPITVGIAGAYGVNNADWDAQASGLTKDSAFMEFDLSVSYAIDANVTYTLDGGYAKTSDWNVADVDANAYVIRHKLSAKF